MTAEQFKNLVKLITVGKKLPGAIYFHKEAFNATPPKLVQFINVVAQALKISNNDWNLVKVSTEDFRLSLLHYPTFFEDSYPALTQSVTVDLNKLTHRVIYYNNQDNPPILHRKETMLPSNHQAHKGFTLITEEGEAAGLYENSRKIGFKNSWDNLIAKHGYELVNGRLFQRSTVLDKEVAVSGIDRHLTAIVRHELSSPMKRIAKSGFLNGDFTIFDYGCGRGDDLRELEAHGIDAIGWDPNFRPEAEKILSDIVNIGFVINVIENQDERIETLIDSWELANKLLVVSVMLASDSHISQFTPYKDGVITSRNTFQKYYTQAEFKGYIERILDEEPVTIAPGILYVFKDKILEQNFLQNRHKRNYQWQQLTTPTPSSEIQERLLFSQHKELLESFWLSCLAYGRIPALVEYQRSDEIKIIIGSNSKAFKLVCNWFNKDEFLIAQAMRKEDLMIYFALAMFGQRKAYTHQPDDLKRDIKAFFDTYKVAQYQAEKLLFNIANSAEIKQQCLLAKEYLPAANLSYEDNLLHALTFHKKFIDLLTPLLRVYVLAALQLYGELDDIQLIKIHIHSGKVTLLGFSGFNDSPLPKLLVRVKIKMAEQEVDFFDYLNDYRRPLLINKFEYINESFNDYKKQKSFNNRLNKELLSELVSHNLVEAELSNILAKKKLVVKGYRFYRP